MRYLVAVLAGSVVCTQFEIQQSAGWLVSWSSSRPLLGSLAGDQHKPFLHLSWERTCLGVNFHQIEALLYYRGDDLWQR